MRSENIGGVYIRAVAQPLSFSYSQQTNNPMIMKCKKSNKSKTLQRVVTEIDPADVEMTQVKSSLSMTPHINRKKPEGKRKRRVSDDLESPAVKKIKTEKSEEAISEDSSSHKNKSDPPPTLESDYKRLCDFYPQCNPDFIWEKLNLKKDTKARVYKVAKEIEEEHGYLKWRPNVREASLIEMLDVKTNFDDLVNTYEVLSKEFNDMERDVSEGYKNHMKAQLAYDFPGLKVKFIMNVAECHNFHYLLTYKELLKTPPKNRKASLKHLRKFEDDKPAYPVDIDLEQSFFKELLFVQNEEKITAQAEIIKEYRTAQFNELKSQGLLETCHCCCNDEIIPDDLLECPEGHVFCKTCIGQSTEVIVGQARGKVPCLNGECETHYTLPVIKKCVTAKIFSLLVYRLQQEELQAAGIENLVTCNFCDYATIIEDPDFTEFKCLNPLCRRETCRLCSEPSHLPLNCKEYKKEKELDIRTRIENEMSEAMVRSCYKCGKRFLRTDGCPVMTCVCGAMMCYICRKAKDTGSDCRCRNVDSEELHQIEVKEAYWKAREYYLKDEADAEMIISKHRIDKLLEAA